MATIQAFSSDHGDEEEYIDMDVSSSSNFLCYSISSPPQSREFEFQMCCSAPGEGEITSNSPADELFYKGNLLPLHLPPRLQMVQKLLQGSNGSAFECKSEAPLEEKSAVHFIGSAIPLEYCGISASESCRVSCELKPDEYFFEWSTELNGFIGNNSKKSWSRKLKQIKQSSISQKLKASRAYLKSLFSKSACSDESCAKAACENVSQSKDFANKYMKMAKKNPFGKVDNDRCKISSVIMKSIDRGLVENGADSHRKSFSGAIKRHSTATKSSSSSISTSSSGSSSSISTSSSGSSSSSTSFSFSSSGFCDLKLLKRKNSANSEIENSIEGAIAHCKQSQQQQQQHLSSSRKTATELGVCSLSASKISVRGDQEKPGICSI